MDLRSEISELLAGFEKRMKFINIVRCLLDYKYPDHIREKFPDKRILDNLIVAVLVFIKDRTLGTEQTCTIADVEHFLEDFSVVLPNDYNSNFKILARYIIVDVLQNGGVMAEFTTFYSDTETFKPMVIRLINEEKGSYHLTDDAFDFLFRSKEIESEIDYSVTRFRMKEYMRRDNYEEALDASRELISRIRNIKVSMDDFLLRCREDISKISVDQYDTVISRIRSLLEDEYKELTEIQFAARERAKNLEEALQNGVGSEDTQKHRSALKEIIENISLTIDEQRKLINKKASFSESYQALIRDNFIVNRFERLNFKKDILLPLCKLNDSLGDAAKFFLFMLTKPEFDKKFSVENFYAPQSKIFDNESDEGIDITGEDTDYEKQIEIRNTRYQNISCDLFRFMEQKERFKISDFIDSLSVSKLKDYSTENALPNVMLSLFAMQELNIEEWKNGDSFTIIPNGEVELFWCCEKISDEFLNIKQIRFSKTNSNLSFSTTQDGYERKIDMTDFEVEVVR